MSADEREQPQENRTVLEKDLANIGSGLGFIFSVLGRATNGITSVAARSDVNQEDASEDLFAAHFDPSHPDYLLWNNHKGKG